MAQRKPSLVNVKTGLPLYRYAARKPDGLMMYHEPPRTTRLVPEDGPIGLRSGALV